MSKHQTECRFKKEGITRLPVLEGEVSHVEIPRTSPSLGITMVGGADTPLRCVVVQEVFPDGLIAQDGRLRPGDQIIEINGVDMTCANHLQVCAALRKMTSVLRLGVYRERIEKYSGSGNCGRRSAEELRHHVPHPVHVPDESALPPYSQHPAQPQQPQKDPQKQSRGGLSRSSNLSDEDMLTVTIERQAGKHLGIRLTGNIEQKPGIFIADIQEGSVVALDGRLQKYDRILFINGQDVREVELSQASALIQNNDKLSLVVGRKKTTSSSLKRPQHPQQQQSQPQNGTATSQAAEDVVDGGGGCDSVGLSAGHQGRKKNGLTNGSTKSTSFPAISHSRSRSEPAIQCSDLEVATTGVDSEEDSGDSSDEDEDTRRSRLQHNGGLGHHRQINIPLHRQQPQKDQPPPLPPFEINRASSMSNGSKKAKKREHLVYDDVPDGEDYLAIYETIDRKTNSNVVSTKNKSHSMEDLETPTPSLKSFDISEDDHNGHRRNQKQKNKKDQQPQIINTTTSTTTGTATSAASSDVTDFAGCQSMSSFLKRALRLEGPQLTQRTTAIKKNVRESLGMRIGGGIGSNEGDTPIYVANIHPHGCIGKSKQLKKGDILLSVDGTSLCGLTHSQAVATLKATINLDQVVLGIMDGPETSFGASNFVPSWMYWQKIPRSLQYPKTVILHRKENASWGFSIVGGADPGSGRPVEPIHVLFVVPDSPAAKDGKLKCGDRLLAVDGQSLENIPHHLAVSMLKRTSTRVVTEVVSWMGTEL